MSSDLCIPGFVDLQVNGFGGVDFSSPDLTGESFAGACAQVLQAGAAVFLPTVITSPVDVYRRNLPIMAAVMRREAFRGRVAGLHLEGPFINAAAGAVGAHHPAWVRAPDCGLLDQMRAWSGDSIRLLTLAAEPEGADELARCAVRMGITVSIGHGLARAADLDRLARAGAAALTHFGNGLPYQLPKFDNPLWPALADDRFTAMLITDGHHLPADVIKVMLRAKGAERIVVVSDGAPIAGLPPGHYRTLGNEVILESNGLLHNPAKGCMVGSGSNLLQCMNHLASLGFLSPDELLAVGFHNPLRLVGIPPDSVPGPRRLRFDRRKGVFGLDGAA